MKKCRSCRWHRKVERQRPIGAEEDNGSYCMSDKMYELGARPKGGEEFSPDHLVYAFNEGGYFWTGNSFGCVNWEDRRARVRISL